MNLDLQSQPMLTSLPRRLFKWMLLLVMTAFMLTQTISCDSHANDELSVAPEEDSLRIVSLSPAITQILKDLKQGQFIVGVGQNDVAAPSDAAVVGTYLDVNAEQLVRLKPTLVLTMSGRDGPPARLTELATSQGFMLINYPYPQNPNDVGNMIVRETEMLSIPLPEASMEEGQEKPQPSIGALLDLLPQAMELKYTMLFRLAELSKLTKEEGSPTTLMVIGTGPVMASGPGTVLDQLLVMAGGRNAAYEATTTAPTYDREQLLSLKPDVILVLDPDSHALGPIDVEPRLADFRGLDIPAVKNNRIVLLSDPQLVLPTSTLDQSAGMMAKALHPQLESKIDAILKASRAELTRKNDIDAVTSQPQSDTPAQPAIPGSVGEAIPESATTTQP